MARLFNRKVNVVVDSLLVSELRVHFKVKKSLRKEPNTCEITITNLSQQTRASMKSKGAKIILQAGYENFISTVFSGDARVIDHKREGADWTSVIQCGDGERAYNYNRISKSFAANTKISTVFADVVKALGIDPGNSLSSIQGISESFLNGYVAHGSAGAELDRLLTGRGFEWSIQDGRLQLLKVGETTNVTTVITSDPEGGGVGNTGLIGSPEHGTPDKKDGKTFLKVKTLLQPQIRPGGKIKLTTGTFKNALFSAEVVEHTGDTAGGEWYTEMECSPVSG